MRSVCLLTLACIAGPLWMGAAQMPGWSLDRKVVEAKFSGVSVPNIVFALTNSGGPRVGVEYLVTPPEKEKKIDLDIRDKDLGELLDTLLAKDSSYTWKFVHPYRTPGSGYAIIEVRQRVSSKDGVQSPLDATIKAFDIPCASSTDALSKLADAASAASGWKFSVSGGRVRDPDDDPICFSMTSTNEPIRLILDKMARKTDASWFARVDTKNKTVSLGLGREFALPISMEHNFVVKME